MVGFVYFYFTMHTQTHTYISLLMAACIANGKSMVWWLNRKICNLIIFRSLLFCFHIWEYFWIQVKSVHCTVMLAVATDQFSIPLLVDSLVCILHKIHAPIVCIDDTICIHAAWYTHNTHLIIIAIMCTMYTSSSLSVCFFSLPCGNF